MPVLPGIPKPASLSEVLLLIPGTSDEIKGHLAKIDTPEQYVEWEKENPDLMTQVNAALAKLSVFELKEVWDTYERIIDFSDAAALELTARYFNEEPALQLKEIDPVMEIPSGFVISQAGSSLPLLSGGDALALLKSGEVTMAHHTTPQKQFLASMQSTTGYRTLSEAHKRQFNMVVNRILILHDWINQCRASSTFMEAIRKFDEEESSAKRIFPYRAPSDNDGFITAFLAEMASPTPEKLTRLEKTTDLLLAMGPESVFELNRLYGRSDMENISAAVSVVSDLQNTGIGTIQHDPNFIMFSPAEESAWTSIQKELERHLILRSGQSRDVIAQPLGLELPDELLLDTIEEIQRLAIDLMTKQGVLVQERHLAQLNPDFSSRREQYFKDRLREYLNKSPPRDMTQQFASIPDLPASLQSKGSMNELEEGIEEVGLNLENVAARSTIAPKYHAVPTPTAGRHVRSLASYRASARTAGRATSLSPSPVGWR